MTVRERLEAGEFENKMPYPSGPMPEDRRKEMRDTYRHAEAVCNVAFRQALAEEHGLSDHPKEPDLWRIAWDCGHSSGYSEILDYYNELAGLMK